jgi:hypothetical protein
LRADTVRIAGGPAAEFVRARIMRGLRILARQSRHDDRKKETIRARGLFTFDTDRSSYRLFGFDDHGFTHAGPVRGACVNDTLTVPRRSPRSHAV